MRAGKTKNKLADLLIDLFGEGWSIDTEDLRVNRGSNRFNDWCSWTGYIYSPDGRKLQIHSWDNMGSIIKAGKAALVNKIDYSRGTEITYSSQ